MNINIREYFWITQQIGKALTKDDKSLEGESEIWFFASFRI
jgi:hypothetical protein